MEVITSKESWQAYLQMMRPANIVTAWADILAGFAVTGTAVIVAGQIDWGTLSTLAWLLLATTGLYGGGIVFNDVFDAQLDAVERPERPLPSGRASLPNAVLLGSLLLALGVLTSARVSALSAVLAATVAAAALIYDAWGKHIPILGSLNMGLCRGGNLLLGVSAVSSLVTERAYLALLPILYIAAVTAISGGEVEGGKGITGAIALLLLAIVMGGVSALNLLPDYSIGVALPFLGLFGLRVLPPWLEATRDPSPQLVRLAVKRGVISLILLDAALAAGFAGFAGGLIVLGLLPISLLLAKQFAVT